MPPVLDLIRSKKFIIAVLGLAGVLAGHFLGMPEERITEITGIVMALLVATGAADFGKSAKSIGEGKPQ